MAGTWPALPAPAGARPRVLLLHGFTGRADDWAPWTARDPSLLALDLPGHGPHPAPVMPWPETMRILLDALPDSIERLVGYSLGGRLALGLLAAAPGRFRAATILSAHPGLTDATERAERRAADRRWIELLRQRGIGAFVDEWERLPLFASQRRLPRDMLERQRARRLAGDPEGLADSLAHHGLAEMPDTWAALDRFPGRLRWIVGGADPRFLAIGRQLAARRPRTDFRLLPGVGHNPLLEAPERLTALLGDPIHPP